MNERKMSRRTNYCTKNSDIFLLSESEGGNDYQGKPNESKEEEKKEAENGSEEKDNQEEEGENSETNEEKQKSEEKTNDVEEIDSNGDDDQDEVREEKGDIESRKAKQEEEEGDQEESTAEEEQSENEEQDDQGDDEKIKAAKLLLKDGELMKKPKPWIENNEEKGMEYNYCFTGYEECDQQFALGKCRAVRDLNHCVARPQGCRFRRRRFVENGKKIKKCCLLYSCEIPKEKKNENGHQPFSGENFSSETNKMRIRNDEEKTDDEGEEMKSVEDEVEPMKSSEKEGNSEEARSSNKKSQKSNRKIVRKIIEGKLEADSSEKKSNENIDEHGGSAESRESNELKSSEKEGTENDDFEHMFGSNEGKASSHDEDAVKCFSSSKRFSDDECHTKADEFCKQHDAEGKCKKGGKGQDGNVDGCKWKNYMEDGVSTCCANYSCVGKEQPEQKPEKSQAEERSLVESEGEGPSEAEGSSEEIENLFRSESEESSTDPEEEGSSDREEEGSSDDEEEGSLEGENDKEGDAPEANLSNAGTEGDDDKEDEDDIEGDDNKEDDAEIEGDNSKEDEGDTEGDENKEDDAEIEGDENKEDDAEIEGDENKEDDDDIEGDNGEGMGRSLHKSKAESYGGSESEDMENTHKQIVNGIQEGDTVVHYFYRGESGMASAMRPHHCSTSELCLVLENKGVCKGSHLHCSTQYNCKGINCVCNVDTSCGEPRKSNG